MKRTPLLSVLCVFGLIVSACVASDNYAPVADVSVYEKIPASGVYRVQPGDTLYSIAWRYGRDYQTIAQANNIAAPYAIHTGERIFLSRARPASRQKVTQAQQRIVVQPRQKTTPAEPNFAVSNWIWPAHGKILLLYSKRNKGIDIGARANAPITAALSGKVVYAGNGLRGYGNLIILKHNSEMLSAYAYNSRLFVREGDWVRSGQKIAEMGVGTDGQPALHFEIRRAGLPVNPLDLLNPGGSSGGR